MLPKVNRLTKGADFKKIAKGAKPIHTPLFLLKKIPAPEPQIKLGIVISAKVSKKATVRNKVKRQLREIIRSYLPKIKKGNLVMIIVKSNALTSDYHEMKKDLENLFKKARLI